MSEHASRPFVKQANAQETSGCLDSTLFVKEAFSFAMMTDTLACLCADIPDRRALAKGNYNLMLASLKPYTVNRSSQVELLALDTIVPQCEPLREAITRMVSVPAFLALPNSMSSTKQENHQRRLDHV